jgi:hypothetical protein
MQETGTVAKRRLDLNGAPEGDIAATDIATYVLDLVRGLRQITHSADQKDVRFLDYLLAITEVEAGKLAERHYH